MEMDSIKELKTLIQHNLRDCELTEEEKKRLLDEREREHRAMIRAFYLEQLELKKKQDPRYAWISFGYRCKYFKDSTDDSITKKGRIFIDNFDSFFRPQHKGIYISGTVGTGKSFLASMIANEMADKGYIVYMARINDAIEQFNNYNDRELSNMINSRSFGLIILDDLGSSRTTDYQCERLYNLIDSIYTSQTPLIVTTNLPIDALRKEQNISLKRVYDRILEMCGYFPPMTGDSKRIEEAKKLMGITKSLFDD